MPGFVLDVSAFMPWCCEDEATAASEELLQRASRREALHVPSLWPWKDECRRGQGTAAASHTRNVLDSFSSS